MIYAVCTFKNEKTKQRECSRSFHLVKTPVGMWLLSLCFYANWNVEFKLQEFFKIKYSAEDEKASQELILDKFMGSSLKS